MNATRLVAREAAADIFFGQAALIWARWFFIAAGAIVALWSATTTAEMTVAILLVVALMVVNFFVHARYLMERPANRRLLMAVSLMDLAIVTALIAGWQGRAGLESEFFVAYFPLVFAFALVFTPPAAITYTLGVLVAYAGICLWADPAMLGNVGSLETLAMRLVTLGAMGGLGTYYWRIQRSRRRAVEGAWRPEGSQE